MVEAVTDGIWSLMGEIVKAIGRTDEGARHRREIDTSGEFYGLSVPPTLPFPFVLSWPPLFSLSVPSLPRPLTPLPNLYPLPNRRPF